MFPTLHIIIRLGLISPPQVLVQFVLKPLAYPSVLKDFQTHGKQFSQQLSYITRTFAFHIYRHFSKLLKDLDNDFKSGSYFNSNANLMLISDSNYNVFGVHVLGMADVLKEPALGLPLVWLLPLVFLPKAYLS